MLKEYLLKRYPGDFPRTVAVRDFVEMVCRRYIDRGLADRNFEANVCSGDDARYWQRLSEALFAYEFLEVGLELSPSHDGPDILIEHEGRKIWVEVICPEPVGVPADWLESRLGEVVNHPHEAILLRWTAAIKEKAEKLLGVPGKREPGYLAKGVVGADDAYVIAVNGRRLRGRCFSSITGISQSPYAVEAVFEVGPYAIQIDNRTFEQTGAGHQHRPAITNRNGSPVPAGAFFDQSFRHISAIFAADIDDAAVLGNSKSIAVVHNRIAANPIPTMLLPAYFEYLASEPGEDGYTVNHQPGRLTVRE